MWVHLTAHCLGGRTDVAKVSRNFIHNFKIGNFGLVMLDQIK